MSGNKKNCNELLVNYTRECGQVIKRCRHDSFFWGGTGEVVRGSFGFFFLLFFLRISIEEFSERILRQ